MHMVWIKFLNLFLSLFMPPTLKKLRVGGGGGVHIASGLFVCLFISYVRSFVRQSFLYIA